MGKTFDCYQDLTKARGGWEDEDFGPVLPFTPFRTSRLSVSGGYSALSSSPLPRTANVAQKPKVGAWLEETIATFGKLDGAAGVIEQWGRSRRRS